MLFVQNVLPSLSGFIGRTGLIQSALVAGLSNTDSLRLDNSKLLEALFQNLNLILLSRVELFNTPQKNQIKILKRSFQMLEIAATACINKPNNLANKASQPRRRYSLNVNILKLLVVALCPYLCA